MRRAATMLATTAILLLAVAPAALAQLSGEGTYGETNDKVVTNAGFILIIFFPVLITILSLVQWRLDKRKDERKKAAKALGGDDRWRGGW